MQVPKDSAAYLISTFQDRNDRLLDEKSAAVELINILRPTVANARYIVFAAMALHSHPEWRTRLQQSDDGLDLFVDEVRRSYPFIPLIGRTCSLQVHLARSYVQEKGLGSLRSLWDQP